MRKTCSCTAADEAVLPLDDAVVVQLSLRHLHDVILLSGDLQQSRLGEPLHNMADHTWQQLVGGQDAEGTNCIFHCLSL